MIASLTGTTVALEDDRATIDVNGVGYLVHASTRTLAALPRAPETTRLLIETVVREDAILLYGFTDQAERAWFRLLTTIQGVGAKVALAILSALPPDRLAAAIAAGDRAALTQAPGVGPKLAVRLATELRDRATTIEPATINATPAPATPLAEALSALANLGYRRAEAQPAAERAAARLGEGATLDAIIRDTLRDLAR